MNELERTAFHADFSRALAFATELHARQVRKQTDIPYISHLISVAGLVLEHGGNRDEAIAALLHDSIEDCSEDFPGGVHALRARIRAEFSPEVLEIVEGCTDSETVPKPPWQERKERYLEHLATASPSIRLVSCCDKLHNARAIVADLRVIGGALFERFTAGKVGTLWYYGALAEAFERAPVPGPAGELRRTVAVMRELAAY